METKSYLVVVTRKDPAEAYIAKSADLDQLYNELTRACETRRRAQIFAFDRATKVTDHQLTGISNMVKLVGQADIYLDSEKELVLQRYLSLTEDLTPGEARLELNRALDIIKEEIRKNDEEMTQLASELKD